MSKFEVGQRVRFSQEAIDVNIAPILRKKYGMIRGEVKRSRRNGCVTILTDWGKLHGFHEDFLELDENEHVDRFPWESHRTLAQVDQAKEPA